MRTIIDILRYTVIMLIGAMLLVVAVSLVFLGGTAAEAMLLAILLFPLMFAYLLTSVLAMDIVLRLINTRMSLIRLEQRMKGGKKKWNKRKY